MNTHLTQDQIDRYQRDGCLVFEEFLSEDELHEMKAAVSEGVEMMGKQKLRRPKLRDPREIEAMLDRIEMFVTSCCRPADT